MRDHPMTIEDSLLMKRLDDYANGIANWKDSPLSEKEKSACRKLHTGLADLVNSTLKYIIDRVTAREMETFTMHDENHALKVLHLMHKILKEDRRNKLTPPEIGLMVVSAYLHDLGMGLSKEERIARLNSADFWEKVDPKGEYNKSLKKLEDMADKNEAEKGNILFQIQQAQEALLCMDCRERHATQERYVELLATLKEMHKKSPQTIPNIESCLSFGGDSFEHILIEICVSHNEEAAVLFSGNPDNPSRPRFSQAYPVGIANADTQLVAAVLRLADILDFDREKTPNVLYHYLLPNLASPSSNVSVREWGKHMAISNWEIDDRGTIVYRGRCNNAIIHHAIVKFCDVIRDEICATKSVMGQNWPFLISLGKPPAMPG